MFKQIADYLFYRQIRKRQAIIENVRHKELQSFKNIKTCLLLFDASAEENYQVISSIVNELKVAGKQVRIVGFVPWKQAPHYCIPKLSWDFLTSKHVLFTGIPKVQFAQEIVLEDYDLLIDFTTKTIKPMQYIAALSMSKLKVTAFQSDNNIYDLIIADKTLTYKQFFKEFKLYLNMLTNESENE